MTGGFPSGPPPDWGGEVLRRVAELVQRLAARVRSGLEDLDLAARRRWPGVRERGSARLRRVQDGTTRFLGPLLSRVRPRTGRISEAARRAWRRARPRLVQARRWLVRIAPSRRQAAVLAVILLGAGWILWERCGLAGCPDVGRLTSYQPEGASVLLDRHGEKFADLAPMEYEVVPLDSLPGYVADAFIAVEDRRFYQHNGVDWLRVLGAAWADLRAGGFVQGSSTIPMQLSRTLFPDRIRREEKTLRRKLLEVRVAREIEDRYSKEEILELYLNHVYLGGGSYGIQSASRYYFGKDAQSLDLEEAAMLAALPRAPSSYDPRRHPEAARARRDLVLALMEEEGTLDFSEAQDAREREVGVAEEPDRDRDGDRPGPYFVQHVRRVLEEELGGTLYGERLRILTTLDPRAQAAAESELEAQLRRVEQGAFGWLDAPAYGEGAEPGAEGTPYLQGAVVVMDVHTGDVLAWVGGRDYDRSRFDRARLARRQAGSAFKPFVYGAALEAGFPPSQPILDAPYRLARTGGPDWRPDNYSGRFEGLMSMREALTRSQNVPAVRLAAAVGQEGIAHLVRRAGIAGEVPESPVAALGVTTASPLEMAVAYASFAGQGARPTPRFVLRVEDAEGNVLLDRTPTRTPVTRPATAHLLTDMLRDVVDRGTGAGVRRAGFHGPAAGKTGTTSEATDVWFVGYTPELVGAVWVGFDEVRPLPSRATGGGVAAPVWGRVMAEVYRDRPVPRWPDRPDDVVVRWVDPETGLVLEDGCRPRYGAARRELFVEGSEPITVCPWRGSRGFLDRVGGWFESVLGSRSAARRIPGARDPDLGVPRLPRRDASAAGAREDGVAPADRADPEWERLRERYRSAYGRDRGGRDEEWRDDDRRRDDWRDEGEWRNEDRRERRRGSDEDDWRDEDEWRDEDWREDEWRDEDRARDEWRRAREELREALERQAEAIREAREARERAEARRRDGGGG